MVLNSSTSMRKEMISDAEIKKLKSSLYRIFALKIFIIFVSLSITLALSLNFIYQKKIQQLSSNAVLQLDTIDSIIHNNLNFMESQVQQFVADTELHRYLITRNELSKQFVLNNWQTIAERLKWFAKIELHTFSGLANITVKYDPILEQAIVATSEKASFSPENNIKNSDKLSPALLQISAIKLNKEYNEPVYPLTPIIDISSNILITSDRVEGYIETSILANRLLEPITQSRKNTENNILLINSAGFYIKGEDETVEWGQDFQSRSHFNFSTLYPQQWQWMQNRAQGIISDANQTIVFKKLSFEHKPNTPEYWLINQINDHYVRELLYQQNVQLIISHLVFFLVVIIAIWYSHSNKLAKRIQRYSLELVSVLFNSGDAIFITDDKWQITTINNVFLALSGYQASDTLASSIHSILDEPFSPTELTNIENDIENNGLWRKKINIKVKNGGKLPCILSIAPVKDGDKKTTHYVSHLIDITEQEAIGAQLKLAAVALETKAGVLITDKEGVIQRVNSSFVEITGYTSAEVIGKKPSILSSGEHSAEFFTQMWQEISANGHWEGEFWNKNKAGHIYPQWNSITSIKDNNNDISNYVSTFYDITARKKLEEKLESMASTDPLTLCLNRRSFEARFNEQVSTAKRYYQTFGMILFDIDHFKQVNDTYGHDQGDAILIQIAELAKQTLREADIIARWGGEEFIILLPLNTIDETLLAAERLRKAFKAMPSTPSITCSFGVTNYQINDDFTSMIKRSDIALYKAKDAGRDKVIVARDLI